MAKGDASNYSGFVKRGLEKFRATADTESAYYLYEVLIQQKQPPEIDSETERLSQRLRILRDLAIETLTANGIELPEEARKQ